MGEDVVSLLWKENHLHFWQRVASLPVRLSKLLFLNYFTVVKFINSF